MEIDVKKEAAKCFNRTWDLLDLKERTAAENAEMLRTACASRYLWGLAGEPKNFARGEWQISRVCAVLGYAAAAAAHAELSLDIAVKNNLGGIDLPFGYEAVARARAISGDRAKAAESVSEGLKAAAAISDAKERAYAEGELKSVLK